MTYGVGFATVDMTPPLGTYLAGLASAQPADGVYHPLRAVAVAVDDGTTAFLVITAEWLGFYELTVPTRARIYQLTGLAPERIVLLATHTHCGPVVRPIDAPPGCAPDDAYVRRTIEAIAACGAEAWRTRAPAILHFGEGTCGFGASRRRPDPNGRALFLLHRPGPHDHRVAFVTVRSPAGHLRGVLFNYACHPTARFGTQIGGDFACFACDKLEAAHPGAIACFLPGCGGDQKPAPPEPDATDFRVHSLPEVRQRGEELADVVLGEVRAARLAPLDGPIRFARRVIELTMENVDPRLLQESLNSENPAFRGWAQHFRAALGSGAPIQRTDEFEIQTICFGRSLMAAVFAAEMTVEHGLRLRQDLAGRFDHVLPIAYANDIVGYIPSRRQIPEGGYEVVDVPRYWNRPGPFVAETEDLIHVAVKEMVV